MSAAEVISKRMGVERALPKISAFYWKLREFMANHADQQGMIITNLHGVSA